MKHCQQNYLDDTSLIQFPHRTGIYAVILNSQQELAVIRTPKGYFLPGGGKKREESDEMCLLRECCEELGWSIDVGELIGTNIIKLNQNLSLKTTENPIFQESRFYSGTNPHIITTPFEKDHSLEWISLDRAELDLYASNQREIINKIKRIVVEGKRIFK